MNEIIPLQYLSLMYQNRAYKEIKEIEDDKEDPFVFMSCLDDLIA